MNGLGSVSTTTLLKMGHVLVYSKFESLMDKIVEKATPSRLDRLVGIARQMQLCWENSQVANLDGYRIASNLVKRIETEVKSCKKIRVLYSISAVLRQMNPRRQHESHEMSGQWPISFGRFVTMLCTFLLVGNMASTATQITPYCFIYTY